MIVKPYVQVMVADTLGVSGVQRRKVLLRHCALRRTALRTKAGI